MAQNTQDQRSFLARLIAGGASGPRGDPFANEASGPFAGSPRVYGGQGGGSAAAAQPAASAVPVPIPRPGEGSNFQAPVPIPRPDPSQAGGQVATSPSSLIQSPGGGIGPIPWDMLGNPNDANATMPKRPFSPSPVMAGLLGRPSPKKATAAANAAAAAPAAAAPFSILHPSTW